MKTQNSLIDAAVALLEVEKKPYDLYQLFDILTKDVELSDEEQGEIVTKFYSDLTTSAKFVYTGDNQWDLKANQKIELWEKDGSFYKEYTKVDLPEEYKEAPKPKKAAAEPVVAVAKPKAKAKKVVEEPVVEVVEEVKPEPVVEAVADKTPVPEFTESTKDEVVANYEEEVFEEFEEFDEDKYNEYMDTYEDQYDK